MKTRLGWTGLLLASILMACGQPQAEVAPPTPQIPPKPVPVAFKPTMLGSITIDFDSRAKTATAHFDKAQTRVTSFPAETDFKFTKAILQVQTPTVGTNRFLTANFSLENLNAVTDYSNVTLIAYHKRSVVGSENINDSAFTNIQDFGGGSSNPATWALQLKPAHGMKTDGVGGFIVDDARADMQVFTPSETSTIQTDAQTGGLINNGVAGEGVLSYGYVARNASNGRSIVHGTTTNSLTIGLQVPQNGDAGNNNTAYRYSMTFLIFADNVTRVTESLEEQAASGAGARATTLGATEVRYLCGSSYPSNNGVFVPGAKTAGVASVLSYLGGNLKITDNTAFNFAAVGNTQLSVNAATGLLSKYATLDGTALGAASGGTLSTNGGNVATASNGSFTFTPLVNSTTADTVSYSVAGCSAPALKAPVSISNMVWYIDSSAAAGGDGRSTGPFQSVSSLNVSAPNTTSIGDYIYVKGSTGNATLTLKNNQQLIGSGVALVVGGNPLQAAGSAPVITSPITVATNNTISGLTVGRLTGTVGGTLTVSSASVVAGAAQAINLTGGNLAVNLTKVNSSGGTNGIQLANTTGSFTVTGTGTTAGSGGVLTGNTSDGVNLTTQFGTVTLKNMQITSPANEGVDASTSTGTNLLHLEDVTISTPSTSGVITNNAVLYAGGGTSSNTLEVIGTVPVTAGNATTVASRIQAGDTSGIAANTLIGSSASMVLKVEKTSFRENDLFGINTQYQSSGATITTIDDNRMDLITIDGSGIRIDTDTPAQTHKLRIKGNTIDLHAGANSGASAGMDIRVRQAATVQALIDANTILDAEAIGINIIVGSAATTANLQATVSNNIVTSADPLALYGIAVQSGVSAGTNATVCLNEQANNVNTTDPAAVANYFIRRVSATLNTFNLSGSAGAITTAAGVQSWLLNAPRSNLPNNSALVSVLGSAAPGFGTCTVVVPTF
jgi:trimeric autotransporter adhesin